MERMDGSDSTSSSLKLGLPWGPFLNDVCTSALGVRESPKSRHRLQDHDSDWGKDGSITEIFPDFI